MKIYAFLNKKQVREEDVQRLKKQNASIYFEKDIKDVPELISDTQEKVLLLQWTGLKTKGYAPTPLVASIPNLKAVCISMTAYSWIDGPTLRKKNIDLCNCPGKSSDSVASYYFFMMTGLFRHVPYAIKHGCENTSPGRDIDKLQVGVVGFGSIGNRFAEIAVANNMIVSYWDRQKKDVPYKKKSLDRLFSQSDAIFVSLAGNSDTQKIITNKHIDSMKQNAVIINCAEDNLIDRKHIIERVENNKLGGFAFEEYQPTEKQNKKYKGNIWAVPEIAYFTTNTLENESRIMTDTCLSYVAGNPIHVVNK